MTNPRNRVAGVALASVVATFALAILLAAPSVAGANLTTNSPALTPQPSPHPQLNLSEQMPAFLNGSIVNTIYLQGNFVGTVNASNSTFGMEPMAAQAAVGVAPTVFPTTATIPIFTVLVPWWGPASAPYKPAYDPTAYGIREMCAPATVAVCWDHPATINVPGLGTVPLPGHDHLIGTANGNVDTWWNLKVVLVYNESYWPGLAGNHQSNPITSIAALRVAQRLGATSASLITNDFLNFAVASPSGAFNPTEPVATHALVMAEDMPAFLNGHVVNTVYENGFFTSSNASHMFRYGMEQLLQEPGIGAPDIRDPTNSSNEPLFVVLVPWWGPSSAPYAPAYNPAAYGIQEMCAPETIALCYDHPSTIDVPGLGVVPLPGHDHLIGTDFHHADTWWSLVVVLITNSSVYPNLAGTHGITSMASLHAAQMAGDASADLDTNTYLNFEVA
jgi:hypothetical protein